MLGRPTTYATNGIVATPHYLASQAGLRVLQEGGNAVDAAIAANAVLNVVLPQQCHAGGDLFALVWEPGSRSLVGLNASGPAPAGATIEWMNSQGHSAMPERGHLAVTVPGSVGGWAALSERFGRFELGASLQAAIGYARNGFPISKQLSAAIELLRPLLEQHEGATQTFLNSGARQPKDILRQPRLAETFERIAREGRDGFYRGSVADDIVATLQAGGSAMTHADLASYEPEWMTPLSTSYRGVELVELPANTQGPTALLMANIVEGWPVEELGHTTGLGIHAYVETKKRAFIERDHWLSDPRFVDIPNERFLDKEIAAEHRAAIDLERAATGSRRGEDGDTVYLCAVDRDGLAVSLIQSMYMGFGSGIVAPRSGVLLHNRGFSFALDPAHANALMPGKRPRHTLIPAMLLRDGEPWVVFGAMGADGQAQTHLQLLLGLVDFGLDPQEAIEVPRWVSQNALDGSPLVQVEPAVGEATIADLQRRGHAVIVGPHWHHAMGHAQLIMFDRQRGVLSGGADPRGDGIAAGW